MRKNKIRRILTSLSTGFVCAAMFAICSVLAIMSMIFTATVYEPSEVIYFSNDNLIIHVIIISVAVVAGLAYKKAGLNVKPNNTAVFLTAAAVFLFYIFFVTGTQFQLDGDQLNCFAAFTYRKEIVWQPDSYMSLYTHQHGIAIYFAVIQKLFGVGNVLSAQFLNILYFFLACLLLSYIGHRFLGISLKNIFIMLVLFWPMGLYVTFVYGTLPGLFCAVLSMCCFLIFFQNQQVKFCLAGRILIVAAIQLKPNYAIFLLAICIVAVVKAFSNKRIIAVLPVVLVLCFITSQCKNEIVKHFVGREVDGGVPMVAYMVMGLQDGPRAPGWYNNYVISFPAIQNDSSLWGEIAFSDLKDRIEVLTGDARYAADFFGKKVASMWCEPTFQSLWIQQVKEPSQSIPWSIGLLITNGSTVNKIYWRLFNAVQSLVYFFAAVSFIAYRKDFSIESLLPAVIVIGGFLYHLLFEAKGQYTVIYFFLIIPYAIQGYNWILNSICCKLNPKR